MAKAKDKSLFLILDGNALLHRAWHAIPPLTTQKGEVVNAVYGFTVILEKLLEQYKPRYMAVAWDLPGGTFRHEANVEYKAQREEKEPELYAQIPMIQELLEGYGIASLAVPGFEADDILGTLAHKFGKKDVECLIVTGDHDTMQLVNDNVSVLTFVKGVSQTKKYTQAEVKERFGVTPSQMIDYKCLVGDTSDNIKGFAGIGPKTAADILNQYGSLKEVLKAAKKEELPPKWQKHFENAEEKVKDLVHLITIRTDVPVEEKLAQYESHISSAALHEQFVRFEFKALAQKYQGVAAKVEESVAPIELVQGLSALKPKQNTYFVLLADDGWVVSDGVQLARVDKKELCALIEGDGALTGELFGSPLLVTHDAKGMLHMLEPKTVQATFFDAILGAYVVDSNTRDYGLEALAQDFLGRELGAAPDARMKALMDLHKLFEKRIKEDGLERIAKLEHETLPVLYRMEAYGIKVDLEKLEGLSSFAEGEIKKLEKEIFRLAGREFNIQSPSQLAVVLFEELKLPTKGIKKTKSGYSTRASELEKVWDTHSIIEHISNYRELTKLKSTYIDSLPSFVDKSARIHTTYNQTGTVTGRLSSTDPNLQNIPIRTELGNLIRESFVAQEGYELVSIDYSQIELRLVADISQDEAFIGAFKNGADIHTFTAARVFGVKESEVTADQRRSAKAINFGILYGMGARSLGRATNVSQTEAAAFIERYFQLHKGIASYLEKTKAFVRKHEYVTTAWGRRRYFPEINSGIQMLVAQAERMAINMPIQGTKADVVKQAMIDVDAWRLSQDLDVRMLLQVHDELVFEMPKGAVKTTVPKIIEIMSRVWKGDVPMEVHCKVGPNWGKMQEL